MRLLKLSCLAILLIAITSCNKTNEKMMELIPENSTFVASFSPSKILDHTGITVDDNGKLQLPGALKELMEFNQKDLDEGIATLQSAEIDPSANVYVYSSITDVNDASAVMLAISKDPEKTKAAIEKEIKESFKTVGDFAILIDKASSFVTFKKIFEYCNVPISIEADLDLKDSILPKLFSNILLVITKFRNNDFDVKYRHGLASIARSFIYQYSDEDIYRLLNLDTHYNILDDIEYLAGLKEIDYSSLFFEITSKMNIYNKISYIGDVSNSLVVIEYIHSMFNMFTDISYSYEQASEYLSNVFSSDVKLPYKVESSSSDCVKIMTIHKSKGLEFPYCYFPLLSSGFNKSDIRASIGFHSDYGIYMPFYDNGKSNTIIKALITDKLNKENISEKVRLLYVALTRAREKMIIVLEEKEEKNINEFLYNSFRDMLDHINVFEDRYRLIDLNDYNLSYQYKMKNYSSNSVLGNEIISYDERTLPKEVIKGRISKEMHELPTKKVKNNINLGLEFHSALEALDFKKLDIDSLPANDFIKTTLKKVFKHPIFERIKEAKTYHEHEFYEVFDDVEYHGIIDLLVIYDDHIDIIDYKLSNVDSSEYVRQLALYKKYVKTKWNKEINVYLLSLINAEIKRLDV